MSMFVSGKEYEEEGDGCDLADWFVVVVVVVGDDDQDTGLTRRRERFSLDAPFVFGRLLSGIKYLGAKARGPLLSSTVGMVMVTSSS